MATWTDYKQRVWSFDDGKLDFDAWIKEDASRTADWQDACAAFAADNADTKAGVIFGQWITYANATTPQ
jgi:hypothetical protein